MAMARIGAIAGDGVNRACLTALDREARRLLIGWAQTIWLDVSLDAAANLWLRRAGTDPDAAPVLTGSHMDTQPNGGRFDGIFGVSPGSKQRRRCAAPPSRPGGRSRSSPGRMRRGRFAPGCMGSMAWSGFRPLDDFSEIRDPEGVRFADALAEHLAAEVDLPRRPLGLRLHAYLEAHIEQGPLLEAAGL